MTSAPPSGYRTPDAMWTALNARITMMHKADPRIDRPKYLRRFIHQRFLARVFHDADDTKWVLKGGTALLMRVQSARHTTDVDLFRRSGDLTAAVAEIRHAATIDLDDHFHFVTSPSPARAEDPLTRPTTQVAKVKVTAYVGTRKVTEFSVDIVVGSVITSEPDVLRPAPIVDVGGAPMPSYLVYPVVDHIADKLCATVELYGTARQPSSRVRDLVDLVVIARTQTFTSAALWHAIEAERLHRGLDQIVSYITPASWANGYSKQARGITECTGYESYSQALTLIGRVLNPILAQQIANARWRPSNLHWQ